MISQASSTIRQTKYCNAIKKTLVIRGHATNNDLLRELRKSYPELSATTVHRATLRLAERHQIGTAPASKDGSMRYDANTEPHDHFQCASCDLLRDTDVKEKLVPLLESSIGDCQISGRLTISGICKKCIKSSRRPQALRVS
jgi:Fur family peroxide stress response transcriptional regulator